MEMVAKIIVLLNGVELLWSWLNSTISPNLEILDIRLLCSARISVLNYHFVLVRSSIQFKCLHIWRVKRLGD